MFWWNGLKWLHLIDQPVTRELVWRKERNMITCKIEAFLPHEGIVSVLH